MKRIAVVAAAVGLFSGAAVAAPMVPNFNNDGKPDLFDAVNLLLGTSFAGNDEISSMKIADSSDQLFRLNNNETPLIGLTASNTNVFGHYTDPGVGSAMFDTVPALPGAPGFGTTGSGTSADPFDGTRFSPDPGNAVIGFFLRSNANVFYSQESLNADGDHMIAYSLGQLTTYVDFDDGNGAVPLSLKNAVLLGFEDQRLPGDLDYDDTMFVVDAQPVPVPAAGAMLAGVIATLAGFRQLRQARAS